MMIAVEKEQVEELTLVLLANKAALSEVTEVMKQLATKADDNELLTPCQACTYLGGISENTLLNYRREGLDYFKKGKSVWYRRGDIDTWLGSGKVNRRARS